LISGVLENGDFWSSLVPDNLTCVKIAYSTTKGSYQEVSFDLFRKYTIETNINLRKHFFLRWFVFKMMCFFLVHSWPTRLAADMASRQHVPGKFSDQPFLGRGFQREFCNENPRHRLFLYPMMYCTHIIVGVFDNPCLLLVSKRIAVYSYIQRPSFSCVKICWCFFGWLNPHVCWPSPHFGC
jgi:hypothetical protein